MQDEYNSSQGGVIGSCPICKDRTLVQKWGSGRVSCEACEKELQNANKPKEDKSSQGMPSNTNDNFSGAGNYLFFNGRRYELSLDKRTRCGHSVMSWLNNGPSKFQFCPSCGARVLINDERASAQDDSQKISGEPAKDGVPKTPRRIKSGKGLAGLSGGDTRSSVGYRTETPKRDGETVGTPNLQIVSPERSREPHADGQQP